MSQIIASHLKAGFIFGDTAAGEYVFMPAGEIGLDHPICVLETKQGQKDVPLAEAVDLVLRLTLKRVKHPKLGSKSC